MQAVKKKEGEGKIRKLGSEKPISYAWSTESGLNNIPN